MCHVLAPNNLRVGDVTQSGDERVVGHKLSDDGKTCETLYEPTTVLEKFLPSQIRASTAQHRSCSNSRCSSNTIILRIVNL